MVTERMFLPLDSEFKVTVKAEQSSDAQQMLDGQCAEMRHLWEARLSKLEIVEPMVRRSWKFGIRAKYLLVAYNWYGAKSILALSIELGITAVLHMKKSKMKYRTRDTKSLVTGNSDWTSNSEACVSNSVQANFWKLHRQNLANDRGAP